MRDCMIGGNVLDEAGFPELRVPPVKENAAESLAILRAWLGSKDSGLFGTLQ